MFVNINLIISETILNNLVSFVQYQRRFLNKSSYKNNLFGQIFP